MQTRRKPRQRAGCRGRGEIGAQKDNDYINAHADGSPSVARVRNDV
jgi:hypothetical protein